MNIIKQWPVFPLLLAFAISPLFFMDGNNIKDMKLQKDVHLILGNEANGISEEVALLITKRVAVKNIGLKTESLNVAMATAIFLHEFCA